MPRASRPFSTGRANVGAAGDVTGRDQFVHMAACGAKPAVKTAMQGDSLTCDNRAMPAAPIGREMRPRQDSGLFGAHVLAPESADGLQTAATAFKAGMTRDGPGAAILAPARDGRGAQPRRAKL